MLKAGRPERMDDMMNTTMSAAMTATGSTMIAHGTGIQEAMKKDMGAVKSGLKKLWKSLTTIHEEDNPLGLSPEMQARLYL